MVIDFEGHYVELNSEYSGDLVIYLFDYFLLREDFRLLFLGFTVVEECSNLLKLIRFVNDLFGYPFVGWQYHHCAVLTNYSAAP